MNEKGTNTPNPKEHREHLSPHCIVDQPEKKAENANPANEYPDDEFDQLVSMFFRYIRSEWAKTDFTKRLEIMIAGLGLIALVVYTVFSILQWSQIRWTNRLTREALNGNGESLQATLDKLQGQINETHNMALQMKAQADQAKIMAENSGTQATASTKSADAAKSAADTAKEALHLSARAFLTTDVPILSSGGKDVSIPIVNHGHIPSGDGLVVVHEATINVDNPVNMGILYSPLESHWKHYAISKLPSGLSNPLEIPVTLPSGDINKVNAGTQQIYLAGTITFNDGFPNTPNQSWMFCYVTIHYENPGRLTWSVCDYSTYTTQIMKTDGYPNNEYK